MFPSSADPLLIPQVASWSLPVCCGCDGRGHVSMAIHFVGQLINASLRHWEVPQYILYIFILYGIVHPLLVMSFAYVLERSRKSHDRCLSCFPHRRTDNDSTSSPTTTIWTLIGTAHLPVVLTQSTNSGTSSIFLALQGPLVYFSWAMIWFLLYAVLDAFKFDKTWTNGVDWDELETSVRGLLVNVAAQAFWLCIQLGGLHLLLPAYPSCASLLFTSQCLPLTTRHSQQERRNTTAVGFGILGMELFAFMTGIVLIVVGLYEFLSDDDTGIGLFMLCVYPTLTVQSVRRALDIYAREGSWKHHPLTCQQQKEHASVEVSSSTASGVDTSSEGAEAGVVVP